MARPKKQRTSIWDSLRLNALTPQQKKDWEAYLWWDSLPSDARYVICAGYKRMDQVARRG